jgi:prevent-host-death family protein
MTILPVSDVKARFSELADEVERTHERLTVTRNGREAVVIMAVDDLDSIEATIELLRDPAAQRRVAEATAEIERGEWLDEAAVRAMVRDR